MGGRKQLKDKQFSGRHRGQPASFAEREGDADGARARNSLHGLSPSLSLLLSFTLGSLSLPYLKTALPVSDSMSTVSSGGWDATSHHLREGFCLILF